MTRFHLQLVMKIKCQLTLNPHLVKLMDGGKVVCVSKFIDLIRLWKQATSVQVWQQGG